MSLRHLGFAGLLQPLACEPQEGRGLCSLLNAQCRTWHSEGVPVNWIQCSAGIRLPFLSEREAHFRRWRPDGPRCWHTFLDRKLRAQNAEWLRGLFIKTEASGVGLERGAVTTNWPTAETPQAELQTRPLRALPPAHPPQHSLATRTQPLSLHIHLGARSAESFSFYNFLFPATIADLV